MIDKIAQELSLKPSQVESIIKLIFDEKATVPFVARYRKEIHGNLDETQIREIIKRKEYLDKLNLLQQTALKAIKEKDKLTTQLEKNILNAKTLQEVEDLYEPYKERKKTKADIAIEKGFQSVAEQIKNGEKLFISQELLNKYSKKEILSGADDIIVQELVQDKQNKDILRYYYKQYGEINASFKNQKKLEELDEKIKKQVHKFDIYGNEFSSQIKKLKEYQILALNRGESLGILQVKITNDSEIVLKELNEKYPNIENCVKEAYKKLFLSIEREVRSELTEIAQKKAIATFKENLEKLLLTKPHTRKVILAIDPGFRTGCKIAVIDESNNPQAFDKIFIEHKEESIRKIKELIKKFKVEYIVIGNGTGSQEISEVISSFQLPIAIVNESGASVYSASAVAKEEFPNLDLTNRGTISIGRRFIDPLSELIKIPVISIGVGMYQHDCKEKELERELGYVVEDVVHNIGINVNTATKYLLEKVSGLTKKSAQKIEENKPYSSRNDLKKILTPKAFELSAGFLRVYESKEEFDSTNIHPEQYVLARHIISNNIKTYYSNLDSIHSGVTQDVLDFIWKSYEDQDDIRKYDAVMKVSSKKIEDLAEGDVMTGVVRNIMQFGAFIDIGVKQNGLVHVSEIADTFVKDINDFLTIGEEVRVKVISVDVEKQKIQLTMKDIEE